MEKFFHKKKPNNNDAATPTSGNKRNAPDPSSNPSSASRNSQPSSGSSGGGGGGGGINLLRPVSSSASSSTGGVSRPSILGARPSPSSVSSGGNPFAPSMFLSNRNEKETSSEFAPQQQRPPPPPSPAQQRPFLQLGAPSPTPRFGAHTAPSSTASDAESGGGNPRGALSGFGCFKSSFFGDPPSANRPAKAQTPPPAAGSTSAPPDDCGAATINSDVNDTSGTKLGKVTSLGKAEGAEGTSLGEGGSAGSVSTRDGKAGGGGRGSFLGKFSRGGSNIATRDGDADDKDSRPDASTANSAEKQLKSPPSALLEKHGKQHGPASAPQQPKPPGLSMLRRPSLSRGGGGGGGTEGSNADRFDVGGRRRETGEGGREIGGRERGDNMRSGNGVSAGGGERLDMGNGEMGFPTESDSGGFELADGGRRDTGNGDPARGAGTLDMRNGEMGFPGAPEPGDDGMGLAPSVARPLAAGPKRSSVGAKPTTVAGDNGDHSSSAAEDDSQRHGSSGRNDVMGLLDDEADAEETRAKMAQREEWIRQKDAAMARFRRECAAEVDRVKLLMEEHVAELETLLDAELVDALDDTIGEKIEHNQREKAR
eukprot:jgi/Undpi1/12073/HiC_scaffold_4.g01771.m1